MLLAAPDLLSSISGLQGGGAALWIAPWPVRSPAAAGQRPDRDVRLVVLARDRPERVLDADVRDRERLVSRLSLLRAV
jgi:hypothetical protein